MCARDITLRAQQSTFSKIDGKRFKLFLPVFFAERSNIDVANGSIVQFRSVDHSSRTVLFKFHVVFILRWNAWKFTTLEFLKVTNLL